ncbi:MAG: flavin reductase family protein [Gemmatimonadales bacterium]
MPASRPPVTSARFRQLCGRFATGVVVITTSDAGGEPAGMTANSFTSVSLDPPLISVNIDRAADFHGAIVAASTFVINVLESQQEEVSRRFAGPATQRFDGIGYRQTGEGAIVLDGVVAAIECELETSFDVGDHTIVVGRVVGGMTHDARPLLYFRGGYHTLS